MALAHSKNSRGETHDLTTHLMDVAKLAAEFAATFDGSGLAYWAGLWHDIGLSPGRRSKKFHAKIPRSLSENFSPFC
jgi:HD superfamily phosphodiesterase